MHRQIAGRLTNQTTKWVVAVIALFVFFPMAYLGSQLTDVQDNEASSWLPASAESTRALEKLAPFQDQNDIPTVVVYERPGGLSAGDQQAIASQVGEIQAMQGVVGQVQGPIPSADGEVAQVGAGQGFVHHVHADDRAVRWGVERVGVRIEQADGIGGEPVGRGDPDLAAEQDFIEHAYRCLEISRDAAWRMRNLHEGTLGGTFQARYERDVFDEMRLAIREAARDSAAAAPATG